MTYQDMKRLTAGLSTKSDKIRALGQAGYPRQQIADFLGIRYQHVRNVLVDAEKKAKGSSELAEPKPQWRAEPARQQRTAKVGVETDGTAIVPAALMEAAGFKPGDRFSILVEGDGRIHLLSFRAALERAREMVRQYIPANVNLVEELLKERHREFEKSEKEYNEWYRPR